MDVTTRPDLAELPLPELRGYLTANSDLPGPRANLALADEAARRLPPEVLEALSADADEFLALAGATGLGRLFARVPGRPGLTERLEELSRDVRWRVREGVVRGLQSAADAEPGLVAGLMARWAAGDDLRLVRAAVAVLCEPRLLRTESMQRGAVEACDVATKTLLERSDSRDGP